MFIGDVNIYLFLFFLLLLSISNNVSSALHLLLTAELLWITLYIVVLSIGFLYDNINFLSLTFFFLVLSAVEFGIGLVIMLVQNIFFRSLQLHDNNRNWSKHNLRFINRIKTINKLWL